MRNRATVREAVEIAKFVIFYVAFLFLLLVVTAYIPVELIDGITEEQVNQLTEGVILPEEPSVVDYVLFPFRFMYAFVSNIILLLQISSSHQFMALILTALSAGMAWNIVKMVRG